MGLLDLFRANPVPMEVTVLPDPPKQRQFAGAVLSRTNSFSPMLEAAHLAIYRDLVALRAHSRSLCQNNTYARRYVQLCSTNIVGGDGVVLESMVKGNANKPKADWNLLLEDEFAQWGESASCDGMVNWPSIQSSIVQTTASDGEIFIHLIRGYPNKWNFALELVDADSVDWSWNEPPDAQGNRTVMGIRMDKWGRRIGYYMWMTSQGLITAHPSDWQQGCTRTLLPASEIIHVYHEDRIRGIRGIPWFTPCMVSLNMLGQLLNAELESAIADAERVAVVTGNNSLEGGEGVETVSTDPISRANELANEVDLSSHIVGLDEGQSMTFGPNGHPNPNLPGFTKTLLEGIASGLGVSYHALSGDVSSANYSASRVALLDERARWEQLQEWFMHRVCEPIYTAWLEMAVASGAINLPVNDYRKLNKPEFRAQAFSWIDPQKEVQASVTAIRSILSTYQIELGNLGLNWRRVFRQRAAEEAYAKELGLTLDLSKAGIPPDPANPEEAAGQDLTPPKSGDTNGTA